MMVSYKISFMGSYYILISTACSMVACMICRDLPQANSETCKEILDNISYPFGIEADDGSTADNGRSASPGFLLSDCEDGSLYPQWNTLMDSGTGPSVLSINYKTSRVNLTWDVDQITGANTSNDSSCLILPSKDHSSLLPISIDFTQSSNFSGLQVSSNTIFLLFNCTNSFQISKSNYLHNESSKCRSFHQDCQSYYPAGIPCTEFSPRYQLHLDSIMAQAGCTHFQFLVTQNPSLSILHWTPHVLELFWNNNSLPWAQACPGCTSSNGSCGYTAHGSRFLCFCSDNKTSNTNCQNPNGRSNRKHELIIGLGASLACISIIVIALSAFVVYIRSKTASKDLMMINSANNNSRGKLLAELRSLFPSENNKGHEFSYQELLDATNSFAYDNMVGDGGFGAVYVGTLKDGQRVAIKKLFYENFQRTEQFCNEIHILSKLSHPNLVKLYGFCCEDERNLLLVFEYVANGNLFDQLHKSDLPQVTSSNRINCWKVRLQVAWEIAEALLYLHTFASPPIFHRDVKTSNILLDEDFHAKLADFGISRSVPNQATHISTNPQGTPGYVDPEYHNCYRLTDKSDVYSFGVVLMELLSGRQAVDMFAKSKDEINLSTLTLSKVADGTWHELLDQSCWASSYNHHPGDSSEPARIQYFSGTPHHRECITLNLDHCKNPIAQSLVELAVRCLQPASANRPHMKDVVLALSGLCKQCHLN